MKTNLLFIFSCITSIVLHARPSDMRRIWTLFYKMRNPFVLVASVFWRKTISNFVLILISYRFYLLSLFHNPSFILVYLLLEIYTALLELKVVQQNSTWRWTDGIRQWETFSFPYSWEYLQNLSRGWQMWCQNSLCLLKTFGLTDIFLIFCPQFHPSLEPNKIHQPKSLVIFLCVCVTAQFIKLKSRHCFPRNSFWF